MAARHTIWKWAGIVDDVRGRLGVLWWAFLLVAAVGGFVWYIAIGTFGVVGTVVLIVSAMALLIGAAGGIDHTRRPANKGRIALPHDVAQVPSIADAPSKPDATGHAPGLLKVKGTNDGSFPRIEAAVDSLGHKAHRVINDEFQAFTEHVLRPGQQVTFELDVTDPNGDDVVVSTIAPARREADAVSRDDVITWNVRKEDIADPAYFHIYVASQRTYHRKDGYDDGVTFVYRVLPSLPGEVPPAKAHKPTPEPSPSGIGEIDPGLTPAALVSLFEGRTALQAAKLLEPHIGKHIRVSGSVYSVSRPHGLLCVAIESPVLVFLFFEDDQADRLLALREGDNITVTGALFKVYADGVSIHESELVEVSGKASE